MTYDPNRPPFDPSQPPPFQQPPPPYAPMGTLDYGHPIPPKPTSVMVISIIGIVLASLGLICLPFAFLPLVMGTSSTYTLATPGGATQPTVVTSQTNNLEMWWTISSNTWGLLLSVLLLVASIGALRLRPWGRTLSILYAIVQLVTIVITIVFQAIFIWPAMANTVSDPQIRQYMLAGGIIGGLLGILIGAALPVAILICYRRPHVIEAFRRGR